MLVIENDQTFASFVRSVLFHKTVLADKARLFEGGSHLRGVANLRIYGNNIFLLQPGKLGIASPDAQNEVGGSKLSLITDTPPPPLEQYVYNEGYPYTPLRPSNRKNQEEIVLSTSNTPDEIFSGAMMARKIGVDRPPAPVIDQLREDNGERLAMERLRYVVLKPDKTDQT